MSRLHARQIDAVELSGSYNTRQLDALTEETRNLGFAVQRRIAALSSQPVDAKVARMRGPHLERVKERFRTAIESFQAEEKSYRDKTKERMARQYQIGMLFYLCCAPKVISVLAQLNPKRHPRRYVPSSTAGRTLKSSLMQRQE